MKEIIKENGWELINNSDYWWVIEAKGVRFILCETQWGRFGSTLYTLKVYGETGVKTLMTGGRIMTCIARIRKITEAKQ